MLAQLRRDWPACPAIAVMPLPSRTRVGSDSAIPSRYAALAAGSLAVSVATFECAEAALVFTSPQLTLDPESDPIEGRLDLNGDGRAEVGLLVDYTSFADEAGHRGVVLGGGLDGASIAFSGRYPMAFQASDVIAASLSFRTAIGIMAFSSGGIRGSRGEWFAGGEAYLGARFQMDGTYFYGWIHAIWDPASNAMTIDLAAYEDSGGAAHIVEQPAEPENFRLDLGSVFDPDGGRIEWVWPVLAGKRYELQRSLDLNNWHTIYTVTPARDGEASYLDQEYSSAPRKRCYYRVKQSEASLFLLALGIPRRRRGDSERTGAA